MNVNAILDHDLEKGANISKGMGFSRPGVILHVKQNGEPLMIGNHRVTVRATVFSSGGKFVAKALFSRAVYTQLGIGVSVSFDKGLIAGLIEGSCRLTDDAEVLCKTKNVCDKGIAFFYGGLSPATKAEGEGSRARSKSSAKSQLSSLRLGQRAASSAASESLGDALSDQTSPVRGKRAAAALGATSVMGGSNTDEIHAQASKRTHGGGRGAAAGQ